MSKPHEIWPGCDPDVTKSPTKTSSHFLLWGKKRKAQPFHKKVGNNWLACLNTGEWLIINFCKKKKRKKKNCTKGKRGRGSDEKKRNISLQFLVDRIRRLFAFGNTSWLVCPLSTSQSSQGTRHSEKHAQKPRIMSGRLVANEEKSIIIAVYQIFLYVCWNQS